MPTLNFNPLENGRVKFASDRTVSLPGAAVPHDCFVAYADGKEVATLTKTRPCEWLVEMTGARNPGVKFASFLDAKEAVNDFIQQQEKQQ